MSSVESALPLAERIVRDAVGLRRDRGMKVAFHEVGFMLGLSPGRVRSLFYGHLKDIWATEWEAIRTRYDQWCDAEAKRLEDRAAILRARRGGLGKEQ